MKLAVNELYPAFQGEGATIGRHCMFLRLAGCPLHCVWCDSAYTWRFSDKHDHEGGIVYNKGDEVELRDTFDIADDLIDTSPMVVITGGEPMVQQKGIVELIEYFLDFNYAPRVEFETAGIIKPSDNLTRALWDAGCEFHFNVSPKLASSGNSVEERRDFDVLKVFTEYANVQQATFKFVVSSDDDWEEINMIVDELDFPRERVYVMPEGVERDKILEGTMAIEDKAREYGYNVSTRLHVLLYGPKRGV